MNPEQQPQVQQPIPAATPNNSTQMNDTVLAAISTIPLIGLIIYFAMPTASDFVKYYAKHGMGLFIAYIAVIIISIFIGFIPVLGGLVSLVAYIGLLVVWVMLLVNALQNKYYTVPVLTDLIKQYIK